MLRCSGFAESRQPLGPAWARGERATHQNGSGPPIRSGQPADPRSHDTLKLRSHAEVTLKTVKRTRAFSDSCSARATRGGNCAGVDLPRTNFGGPCPEPQRPGGSLDPESRGPLGCREGHFRYRHVPHSLRGVVEKPWEKRNCTCCCDAGSETHLGQGSCAVCLHGTCGRASCRDGKLT
jgi:hypothetical protein